jgi:uncharacterized DUF497 family protein
MRKITYDPAKRAKALKERGLDFEEAGLVFAGPTYSAQDDRRDYGEFRYITVGLLRGRMVVLVWTPRYEARHIISFRKANDREEKKYKDLLG